MTLKFSPLSRVRARRSRSTKVKGVLGGVRVRASQDRADFADSARFSPGSLSASLCVTGLGYRKIARSFVTVVSLRPSRIMGVVRLFLGKTNGEIRLPQHDFIHVGKTNEQLRCMDKVEVKIDECQCNPLHATSLLPFYRQRSRNGRMNKC